MNNRFEPRDQSQSGLELRTEPLAETAEASSVLPPDNQHTATEKEDATTLTDMLQTEARNRSMEELMTAIWSGAFVTAMLWIASRAVSNASSLMTNLQICFALMYAMATIMIVQICRRSYRRKRSLTRVLSQIHDINQLGPLIGALQVQNTPVRKLVKKELAVLLPTLQASDASRLGDAERKILLRWLAISPNDYGYRDLTELFSRSAFRREVDLRVAILKALEQVGGEQELPTVERLSRGLPSLQSAARIPAEVRMAATECLPYLQTRLSEQRASTQLLRASSVDSTSEKILLRPATAHNDADPNVLLRATAPHHE